MTSNDLFPVRQERLLFPDKSIENLPTLNVSNINTILSTPSNNNDAHTPIVNGNGVGKVAKAVLICHPSSYSFLDRTLILDKPVKIGRSVGHNKTLVSNGIFDCKVLSRNHALIWFEDGRFLLRDTKSSNGTFVNTDRLSKSNEESLPREVFSGDTVQFGVDVIENSRNVTHGCVIATLKLFLPNGHEAKPPPTSPLISGQERNKVTLEDLYHLNQYLQESLQREQMLESKLVALKTLMKTLRDSTELSWKALISNNSLLSRVELLEVQLKCYSKKFAEDELREELRALQEDKNAYEGVVKRCFQKILDEKIEATQQCQDLNRALEDAKTEYANMQKMMANYQSELKELAGKNSRLEKDNEELEVKLQVTEESTKEIAQKLKDENTRLCSQVKNLGKTEEVLQQTIKELETHGDYAQKKVMSLQNQVDELQKHHSDILSELVDPATIKTKINDVDLVMSWISVYSHALKKCEETVNEVRQNVDKLGNEKLCKHQQVSALEADLTKLSGLLQNYKLEESEIENRISEKKSEIEMFSPVPDILDELNEKKCNDGVLDLQEKKKLLNVIHRDICQTEEKIKETSSSLKAVKNELIQVSVSFTIEEDKLDLAQKQLTNLESVIQKLTMHLDKLGTYEKGKVCIEDVQSLKKQLSEAHELAQEKQAVTEKLLTHFLSFLRDVNSRQDSVESKLQPMLLVQAHSQEPFEGELKFLKMESSKLSQAVDDLHIQLEKYDDQLYETYDYRPIKNHIPVQTMELDEETLVIWKEKCRSLLEEKLIVEHEYARLKEQYDSLTSYPGFNFYFVLPIIVILAIFSKFYDKLSFIFGTHE